MTTVDENLKKNPPKKNPFMPDELRCTLIDQLVAMGVDPKEFSDDELIKKTSEVLSDESSKRLKLETEKAIIPLNIYCNETHLKNKELLQRLFNLNVPHMFLRIFEDEDIKLKDDEIWAKVRKSNVRQIEDPKEIFKNRTVRAFNVNRERQ
jgi:hypothetical protein